MPVRKSYEEFKATFGMTRKEARDTLLHAFAVIVMFVLFMGVLHATAEGLVSASAAAPLLMVCAALVILVCFNPPAYTRP